MFDNLKKDLEKNMKKSIDSFKININKIYIGRASSNMLNSITVKYYDTSVPIYQLTNTIVENPQTLIMTVFDSKMVKVIEKTILSANLGLTLKSDNNIIRIILPVLTEDRRHTLIKMVRIESEKSKISVRNIRRIFNEKIKIFIKNKEISADDEYRLQNEIQNLTNNWIKVIDSVVKGKELELMKF